ncbi:MAG: hypothetical protein IPL47_05070 [Phyllobacteriaceae bacterium]|nr:hypothetical protein [Phyllobacteriaceae bacterium]
MELNMTGMVLHIPFPKSLYDDIVRFSDGKLNPAVLAENLIVAWIERDLEFGEGDYWGERIEEVAEVYAPHLINRWESERASSVTQTMPRPLIWKKVEVPSGSEVRMAYDGMHHYAEVRDGKIVENGNRYTPSEWASKVANGTSRNAWRDLWFRKPLSKNWDLADDLRKRAAGELKIAI